MQNRSGYCSFCCVFYNNLEQHLCSDCHRSLITQKRQRMGAASLMERFLRDVLQHHPCHYQESRSMQNERLHMTTGSPSEVVPNDDFSPEIKTEDAAGVREEISTKASEPIEKVYSRPQGYMHSVSDRPSVIQKLEKGQQHPLEFIHKIGSSMKEFNPVGISHSTNNRQSVICSSVISNAPVSCLPESSHEKPVTTDTTTGLSLGVHLDLVNKCDPNKADKYLKQLNTGSRNPMLPSHPETSSVPYQKPKELNRKSLCINSDKLTLQEDVNSQTKALSTDFKVYEFVGTENSLKLESLSKFAVNPVVNLSKTDMPSNKGIFEDDIPKHHEKFFPNMDYNQEGKHLVFNKSAFWEQKIAVSSEMKFAGGSLQSASDHCEEAEPDLGKGEQTDQEDKNCGSRDSAVSFDGSSSLCSLMDQSKVTVEEINLSKEVHTDLQYKKNTSYISERSSDCDDSLQVTTSKTQVKDESVQKVMHITLVDESYESSDSEMNFDCDASLQSTDDGRQQPEKEVNLPKGVLVGLVDTNYGSSSSEISADSVFSLQSMPGQFPVTVTETELQKKVHISLVDKNYGSSCSETSFDCDVSLQSVFDHPHMAVSERNLEDRPVSLKDSHYKSSSAKAYLDCDVSLETVSDGPQKDVENINLRKEKNDLVDMNCEFHGPEIKFHLMKTDPQLVPAQSQVAVKEVNAQEVAIDLENKSIKSSISDLSFDSHPMGSCGEINLKALNVDMEVKSYGCSSCESTFDSDSSFMSVSEYPELDVEEINKKHVNLEDESFESISSEITFYSDSPLQPVVDQSQVTVYEEDPIDLENKSNESCVSEITFDSGVPLHSGTYQPEVVVKETFIQKEVCTHLGEKDDAPTSSEISLASYIPFHSVIKQPEEAVKNLNPQKEEWVHLENKGNESGDSEMFDYDIFRSMTGHSEDPIKERNLQKGENIHLENKDNVPVVSENSLKSGITFHLVTGHLSIAIKEINQKEEHVNLTDKSNELKVSETSLDTDTPVQSVTHRPELIVKELGLQKEKHAKLKGQSAEYSGSEISLDSDYSMTEPQIAVKEISVQKEEHVVLENKSGKYSSSEIILGSDVPLQSMNEKPQTTVLKDDHVDPKDESTGPRGFEKKLNTNNLLHLVIDQPQLVLLKEKHVHLEDTNKESSYGKIDFDSADPLQPLTEQFQEVVEETKVQKEEDMSLKNKVDEPNDSELIYNSDVSLPSVSSQPKVAVKQINLKNKNHVYLKDKNRQDSGFAMSLNSDLTDQLVVGHPQITILEQKHTELGDKHNQSCGSEINFNSDDPFQSVANQLRQTVKETSPWRDEVDMEDKRDEPKHFEIVSDSDVSFQSVAGQTEVVKDVNLLKDHVDLEDKVVKPSDSKIDFVSDGPFQSVANEVQEAVTEMNLLREGPVCLSAKSYEPNDSEIIFVSNTLLQSVVEPHHDLEEQQTNLEDKSNDPCGPKINFVSEYPLHSVTGQLQKKAVKEIGLWDEDHIYLEDKRYKVGDFEVSYDSDVDFVAGHSAVAVKEINLQEEDQNDLENKNCELSVSEIKCDSGVHLQLGVDQPQVACKEINLQMEKYLGMEEVSEPRESEIMCDSDVPLQIVINELEESDRETDKMLFMDLTASDNDCEMISDSDVRFQPVIDSPQRTAKEISCINAESFDLDENCDSCDSELRYVCEASPQSVTNHSKKVFKVVKQKQDYIILEETSCEPYVSELSFQIDSSHQSMTYQSQESEKKKTKYSDPKDKSCQSSGPKRNFEWEETSQPVTQQKQKVDKGVNLWKDVENIGLKDKNCESGVSTMDCNASPGLVIHQMPDQENLLKLKHTDLESMSCEPCGSGVNFQRDPSLQSGNDRPQEAVNKINLFKKMSFDQKETNHNNSHSDSVPVVDSIRNLVKAKEVIEDDLHELLPEDLPPVPPSFLGKTWSQIMKEDDVQMSALMKEFKKDHFYCYFVSDCEMRKRKKNFLNEKKVTWTDLNQDTTSIQILSDCDDNKGGISHTDDFSVALDKPNHHPSTERNHEQTLQVASQDQAIKDSHGTQTNLTSQPGTKRIRGQEKDSPVRKCLLLQNNWKTREKVKKNEFPESCIGVLKPLQANTLIYILSSNIKLKKGESNRVSKRRHCSRNNWDINIQYKFNQTSFNCYDPLNKQIVIDPPLNIEVPGSDRNNCVEMHVNHLNSNAEGNDPYVQSCASVPLMTLSVEHELKSGQEASESSVFPEKSKIFSSSEISKESNFQSTFSSRDVANTSSKSFRKKFLKSKSKNQRRKVSTNNKPDFPKKGCRSVIPQQNIRIASEKRSIWIQSKLSDIIKKYIPKYSVFLRHKYQSRSTFVRMHIKKKKANVSRLKKAKKPANMLSNTSVLSAGAEEQSRAIASSSPKQRVQTSSSVARSKNGNKKHPRRQQRKPCRPIRTYDLRSLFSGVPYSDRMKTRFSNKS